MKFAVINGSHRQNSQSLKVAQFTRERILSLNPKDEVYFFSLAGNPLPFWDDDFWDNAERWQKVWGPISKELTAADAVVVVVPEWHGMAPGGVKNFFHLCSNREVAHKPGLLIGVSAGMGGAYPIAEMRMSAGKNTRICFVPDHMIVRYAEKHLNTPEPTSEEDSYIRGRIDYSLKVLREYGQALKQVRASGVIDYKAYPSGL